MADLAGLWSASEFVYSRAGTGPAPRVVDLIDEGQSVTMDIREDGRFELRTLDTTGAVLESNSGTLAFEEEGFLVVTLDDEPGEFIDFLFVQLSQASLRLEDREGQVEFDLDGDGTDELARLQIVFERS